MACSGCSVCDQVDPIGFGVIRLDPTLTMTYAEAKAHVMQQFQFFYTTILVRRYGSNGAARHARTTRGAINRMRRAVKAAPVSRKAGEP